ncbi:fumarylacetoacetate hydrolase family protein [Jannaschia sp. KMU-145]|uniref:fumarylacetoacetate hydrolase family protein n=1 Tax=Jannaschia halovivens TaxID=3388667 RepID=UPI00396B28B1
MNYVIPAPIRPAIAVADTDARFPLRRIFCVGRNYAAHAREMGRDPDREPPFFFTKPADAAVTATGVISYPPDTSDLHHEVELVVALGSGGTDLSPEAALGCIWGATVGIDLTRRDRQQEAKDARRPWDWGKAFDASAPLAPLMPMAWVPSLTRGAIRLSVNGDLRQSGDLSEMIWPVAETIAFLSRSMAVSAGDLIMTGTPAGVGALVPGDRVEAEIEGLAALSYTVGPRATP